MLVKANLNGNEVEYDDKEFEVLKEEDYKSKSNFKYLHYIGNGGRVLNPKGNISCYKMFFGCEGLTILDLSNFDTRNVTNMEYMFSWCGSLTTLDLSSFDTRNVTSMIGMFYRCGNLTTLDLSSFGTKNVTDITDMFSGCENLVSVKLNLNNLGSYDTKAIKKVFLECNISPLVINSTSEQGDRNVN